MAVTLAFAVTNESSVVDDAEVERWIWAWQHQANYHFAQYWHAGARIYLAEPGAPIPKGMVHAAILDNSDQAGALGYHDFDPSTWSGSLKVFAMTDQQYGLEASVTGAHEILETLADLWISSAWQFANSKFWATEVCDPVEADEDGYKIKLPDGSEVLVTNFCLPRWFWPGSTPFYDRRQLCKNPGEIRPGGYMSIYDAMKQRWTQVFNNGEKMEEHEVESDHEFRRPRPSQDFRRRWAELQRGVKE